MVTDLYEYTNPHNGKHSPMVSKELLDIVMENADVSSTIHCLVFYLPLSPPTFTCLSPFLSFFSLHPSTYQRLNSAIIYDRDFGYNFFGFKVGVYIQLAAGAG